MIDLTQALGQAAHAATSGRPDLAAGDVLRRIRRRRTVRLAAESGVGVAAAGAIAFAGVQLADRDEPVPPATPTPTPTTTPTPTPTPEPTAPVVTTAGELGCGLPLAAIEDPAGDTDVHLVLAPEAPTVVAGGALDIAVTVVNGSEVAAPAPATDGPRLLVAQGGAVVGGLVGEPAPAAVGQLAAGGSATATASWTTAACDGATATGAPLPAGTYEVYAAWELANGPGSGDVGTTGAGTTGAGWTAVVGGPWRLVVEPAADAEQPDPHPALAELVVSPSGLGPLAVGVPPEANPGAAMIEWDADHCASELFEGTDPGRWVPAGYDDDPGRGDREPFGISLDDTGRVAWIDVRSDAPRTAEGVGLGTTLADLEAAYPDLQGPFQGAVSQVWWVENGDGILAFETQGEASGLQPPGTPEQVILMRVLVAGSDPLFATANTDWMAGGCL